MWREPDKWVTPENEAFYGNKVQIFEHTILEYNHVEPYLKDKRLVIDIGAHIGSTAVRYAKDFEKVEAFEPMYFNELILNTGHLDNIVKHKVALSNYDGIIEMRRHKNNSGMSRVVAKETTKYIESRKHYFTTDTHIVETKPLDYFNFKEVDLIKMDTEGYVLPVLEGATNTLMNNNPILQIECKENTQMVDDFLKKMGYHLYDTFSVERFYKK